MLSQSRPRREAVSHQNRVSSAGRAIQSPHTAARSVSFVVALDFEHEHRPECPELIATAYRTIFPTLSRAKFGSDAVSVALFAERRFINTNTLTLLLKTQSSMTRIVSCCCAVAVTTALRGDFCQKEPSKQKHSTQSVWKMVFPLAHSILGQSRSKFFSEQF